MSTRPRPSLARVALLAAPVALVAGVGAGFLVDATNDDDDRTGEVELRFTPEDNEAAALDEDRTGEAVPESSFDRLGGGSASLADYEGRPLVVNFFASFCEPCKDEMPALQQVADELGDDVAFLGIGLDEQADDAAALVAETGVDYDLGLDPDASLFEELGGLNLPTTYFVSAEGEVVEAHPGALSADEIRDRSARLLR